MIQVPGYEAVEPPARAVRTEPEAKPTPSVGPVDIWESTRIVDTTGHGAGEKDRVILFSGGDDSLALTHLAMEHGWADYVIHLATNSSIPENIDYVRRTCREYGWPFCIIQSPMPLDLFAYRYGFPGSSCHGMAYRYFKSRQLAYFWRQRTGDVKFFSGVRQFESDRRMENISAEVQYEDASSDGDFTGWWISPMMEKPDQWVIDYRRKHDLPRNPVSKKIDRSGDCQCLSFGHREEELILLEAAYPEFTEWLLNVETRTQEYRGRVSLLEDAYPDVAADIQAIRKSQRPHPMKLTVLKAEYPEVFEEIASVSSDKAVLVGQTEETNYIGHGGLSSQALRAKTNAADNAQKTLCETCSVPAESISPEVRRATEHADSQLQATESIQQTLVDLQS